MVEMYESPFLLFPLEIWEMVCCQIENPSDIESVLHGLSEVGLSIKNQKRYYYVGKILSSLCQYLTREDILNLRLVCKQWRRRVDNFIVHQPYNRAISENGYKEFPNFFAFMDTHVKNFVKAGGREISATMLQSEWDLIQRVLINPVLSGNPVPFRRLIFNIEGIATAERNTLERIGNILSRCGNEVWYLKLILPSILDIMEIGALISILRCTPNLKRLVLDFTDLEDRRNQELEVVRRLVVMLRSGLPILQQLESLKIRKYDHAGQYYLSEIFATYCPFITRFKLYEFSGAGWGRQELSVLLPRLKELRIGIFSDDVDNVNFEDVSMLLNTLESSELLMLELRYMNEEVRLTINVETDVFPWLRRFTKIKYLEITPQHCNHLEELLTLKESGTSDPKSDEFKSVEILKLVDGGDLEYKFLKCFSCLKKLEIYTYYNPKKIRKRDLRAIKRKSTLRSQIVTANIYECSLWKDLPKLNTIVLHAFFGRYHSPAKVYTFNRSTYLKLCLENALTENAN